MSKPNELISLIQDPTQKNITIFIDQLPPVLFIIGDKMLESTYDKDKFLSESNFEKFCIQVDFLDEIIELSSYYYDFSDYKNIDGICQPMEHEHFFNILDFFSQILNQPIKLSDTSVKWLHNCDIKANIMYFVKNQTFYERYGFVNKENSKKLQLLSTKQFMIENKDSFLTTIKTQENKQRATTMIQNIDDLNNILHYQLLDDKPHYITDIVPNETRDDIKQYIKSIYNKTATVTDIAIWFYLLCEMDHTITHDERFQRSLTVFSYLVSMETDSKEYVRQVSTKMYKYTIEENKDQITLKIQSIPTSSAEAGGKKKRKTKKYKKRRKNTHRKNKI